MKTDLQLQKDVLDEISWDPKLRTSEIGVACKDGIVTLSGFVSSFEQKMEAEQAVYRVSGVKGVAEEIEVRLPGTYRKADSEVAANVVDTLKWNTTVPDEKIKIKVEDGWVTITGTVNWWYEKNEAEKAVERLSGVRGVVNLIEIKPTISSNVVKDEIEKAFKRNASLVSKNVKVEIQGNKVILNGKLPDWHAIHEAETAAWAAPGVQEVVNNIRIEIPEYIETY